MKEVYTKNEIMAVLLDEQKYLRDMYAKLSASADITEIILVDCKARLIEVGIIISEFICGEEKNHVRR